MGVRELYEEAVEASAKDMDDVKAGGTKPAGEFLDEFAQKHGLPR